MTTIAITETDCAADGWRTWGDQIRGENFKKLHVVDGSIYAFTGLAPLMQKMIEWHRAGADPEKLPSAHDKSQEGWTLIVVDHGGIHKLTSSCPYEELFDPPIAFGAGQDYAMGAMLAGATAQQAVEIVAKLCNHTGGEIQNIKIHHALEGLYKDAAE